MALRQPRLLILSAGSAVAQQIVDALGPRRAQCVLIGANSIAEAACNFRCDRVHLAPPAASGAPYIERIRELIAIDRPHLVIPTRDDDALALAQIRERYDCGDTVLLAGSAAAARMFSDKVETARFARRHGLPFAATASDAAQALDLANSHPLPLIGKPRSGNASRGVVLLRSAAEIERAFALHPDLIAQPYLDPPPGLDALTAPFDAGLPYFFSVPGAAKYSVEVIVGPDGAVSRAFAMLSAEAGGRGVEWRRRDDADLLEVGTAFARAAAAEGWRGPVNVQLKRTREAGPVAFELNGRLNGGTAPRTLLGFDEVGEVMARFVPALDFAMLPDAGADIVQMYLTAHALPRDALAALQSARTWPPLARES